MSDTPYREPAPRPPDPYLVAWADLRKRRRAAVAVMVTAGTAMVVVTSVPHGILAAVPACVLLGYFWRNRLSKFLCPACGKTFGRLASGFHNEFTLRCLHCGIVVGTPKNAP